MNEAMPEERPERGPGPPEPYVIPAAADGALDLPPDADEDEDPGVPRESGPAPLGVPRTPTGNPEVDARLERLADADHLPADGHLEVYEDVHRGLRDTLTALDSRPDPGPGPLPGPRDHRS